ncbi:hypothetical protein AYO41_03095 [Verrucomicrobia bacterium SCGC AG-212-E04]|nr:hypothetical protein AYO41_03095 [Verrucomicrobia bacterium SCGC AG-212-E04]
MITGLHAMFYSSDPEATRAFLRDKLGLPANDVGGGWLIFGFPESELGVHPTEDAAPHGAPAGTHQFSFFCDDIKQTVSELKARGVEFAEEISDTGWGLVTRLKIPGGCEAQIYQPRYARKPAR